MELKELLVVIPHSGIVVPGEIPLENLSERFPSLVQNVDWYTKMNFQYSYLDEKPRFYCPNIYVETYATELRKRLPNVKVTVNSSEYSTVYGHVCTEHSVNAMGREGNKVPAIIQETNERLYKNPDRTPNVEAINRLRRAFAESIKNLGRHTP